MVARRILRHTRWPSLPVEHFVSWYQYVLTFFFQGKGTLKTYWLVDFANQTPRRKRRSFYRKLKGPADQSSGLLGILDAPPSPCRLSRASSLRRTMKAIQCESPAPKGRHVIDVVDVKDISDDVTATQTSVWYLQNWITQNNFEQMKFFLRKLFLAKQ